MPVITVNPPQSQLLLIAPHNSYRISPYISAARQLGIDVLVASTSEYSLVSAVADGLRIDLEQPEIALERILDAAKKQPFIAVIATDDTAVHLAAQVAKSLGLPHNPPEAVQLTHRKDLARARLAQHKVPVPAHQRIDLHSNLEVQANALSYPAVLKPLSLSGSRGVIRVNDPSEFLRACERIRPLVHKLPGKDEKRYLLAETYLPGIEVAVEAILDRGQLHILAIFDKPEPLEGPFFEESYYITPSRLSPVEQTLITTRVSEACAAYGLCHGPVHAELRLHHHEQKTEAWILEIAARTIGGQCAQLIQYATGMSLEQLVISQALGRSLPQPSTTNAAGVLMIPTPRSGILRRIEGLRAARQVAHIIEVEISVREGYELLTLPEGSAYLGFIFAQGPDPETTEAALRAAHDCLNIVIAPLFKLNEG